MPGDLLSASGEKIASIRVNQGIFGDSISLDTHTKSANSTSTEIK